VSVGSQSHGEGSNAARGKGILFQLTTNLSDSAKKGAICFFQDSLINAWPALRTKKYCSFSLSSPKLDKLFVNEPCNNSDIVSICGGDFSAPLLPKELDCV